jgi:zinc D-Ala-D-Ala carboxypeptidase
LPDLWGKLRLNNVSSSRKSTDLSKAHEDDIPEAVRDIHVEVPPKSSSVEKWMMRLLMGLIGLGVLALASSLWLVWRSQQQPIAAQSISPTQPAVTTPPPPAADPQECALLGHFPYEEAPNSELEPIVADSSFRLRKAAAQKYLAMVETARAEGVHLVPISAFRSVQDQETLFFDVKAQRGQDASERADVSAPPGYSEHHTGYAIDIGDGDAPSTHLSPDFATTAAFKWLEANAAFYSFELSFTKGNTQGIAYEPWHWRYVGDRHSLETFYRAHSQRSTQPEVQSESQPAVQP